MSNTARPLPHRLEKKLSHREQTALEDARQGKRDTETMAGWSFRFGSHGVSGRKAVQCRPYGHNTWFWVAWCTASDTAPGQMPSEVLASGFDRL